MSKDFVIVITNFSNSLAFYLPLFHKIIIKDSCQFILNNQTTVDTAMAQEPSIYIFGYPFDGSLPQFKGLLITVKKLPKWAFFHTNRYDLQQQKFSFFLLKIYLGS